MSYKHVWLAFSQPGLCLTFKISSVIINLSTRQGEEKAKKPIGAPPETYICCAYMFHFHQR